MRTASPPSVERRGRARERQGRATRWRRSGSVSRRTPSRSTKTVACPTNSILAKREALHAVPESLRLRERLELLQRVVLDLTDALTGHAERLPDLLECARL